MRKTLYLMFICALGAFLVFPAAACMALRERDGVAVTEEVISGNPGAAEGFSLEWKTDWQEHLLWNTSYVIGSGEAESECSFQSRKVRWSWPYEENISVEIYAGWGSSGMLDPAGFIWPEITMAVAERTKPGERHTEQVRFADYYRYYPVMFRVTNSTGEYTYDSSDADRMEIWTDYFRIPVQESHLLDVTVEKDAEGNCIEIDCNTMEGGLSVYGLGDFGEKDCYFTFNCETDAGEFVYPEGTYGIYYIPDVAHGTKESVEMVCGLEEGVVPIAIERKEKMLCLVTMEGGDICLKVYELEGKIPILRQSLAICETKEKTEVYWQGLYPAEGGLLLVWSDSGFVFVEEKDGQYQLFCQNVFPGGENGEQNPYEEVFPKENAICFDGERLALAAYTSWADVDVNFAVYGREEMLYHGVYHNSGRIDRYVGAPEGQIQPQGYGRGGARPEEPLKIKRSEDNHL